MQTSAFTVGPLRGMDQRWKPSPDTGMRVRDLTWDGRDGWKTSGGFRRIVLGQGSPPVNPYTGTGVVTSLHFFTQHNGGRAWLVYESGGALFAFNGSNRATGYREALTFIDGTAVTGRKQLSTPWQRTQSVSWAGRIYLVNGYDTPLVYDGLKVERAGFDNAPAAPQVYALGNTQPDTGYHMTAQRSPVFSTATTPEYYYKLELGLGPILDTNTDEQKCGYRYKVTFVNERGQESPASAASALATFRNEGGDEPKHGGTPVGVNLPVGGSHVVARRVYRTQNVYDASGNLLSLGFGDVYYFHSEVQDNVTTVMADILPDSFLGGTLDEEALGPWPVGTKYLASFKDTMFVAGGTTNEVRFSAPRFPEVFPPDNVMDIGDADLGPVTGLYGTRNAVVVFKQRGVYLIKGDPVNGFFAITLTKDVGCQSPNAVTEVPNVGLCFLSEDGVYVLQGTLENEGTRTSVIHLSTPVSEIVKRINRSALPNACAVTYHRDKEAWWAIPTLGQEYPNVVLVYHYEVGAWSFRENLPILCMRETSDQRGQLLFGSYDTKDNLGIQVYSRGWEKKGTTSLQPLFETNSMDLGSLYRSFQPRHAMVYAVGYGDNGLTLNYTVNRSIDDVRAAPQELDQQYPNDPFPVYGTAVWGTDRWARLRQVVVRFDLNTQQQGPVHELSLTIAPAKRNVHIFGFDLETAVGEQRNIKPLSTPVGVSQR